MASLYVGNLHPDCTEATLYHKFSPVGNVLNICLFKDKLGRCLGHGYINYASKSDAQSAIISLNYSPIKGRTIRLMWAEKNRKKLSPNANVFIKNLDANIDERSLHDIFANYGDIVSLKLAKNEDGSSKGFAFVQFEDEKAAEDAIKDLNKKLLYGKVVHVAKFLPKDKRVKTKIIKFKNIYLKNFDFSMTDETLAEMCNKFGNIVSAKVMLDEEGNSKGFGFVSFKDSDSAKEAVKELHGKMLNGRRLFADRAKRKQERQKEVKEHFKKVLQNAEKDCLQLSYS